MRAIPDRSKNWATSSTYTATDGEAWPLASSAAGSGGGGRPTGSGAVAAGTRVGASATAFLALVVHLPEVLIVVQSECSEDSELSAGWQGPHGRGDERPSREEFIGCRIHQLMNPQARGHRWTGVEEVTT